MVLFSKNSNEPQRRPESFVPPNVNRLPNSPPTFSQYPMNPPFPHNPHVYPPQNPQNPQNLRPHTMPVDNYFSKQNPFADYQQPFIRFKVQFSDGNIRATLVDSAFLKANPFNYTLEVISRMYELHFGRKPQYLTIYFKDEEGDRCIFDNYSFSLLKPTSNHFFVEEIENYNSGLSSALNMNVTEHLSMPDPEVKSSSSSIQAKNTPAIVPATNAPPSNLFTNPTTGSNDPYAENVKILLSMGFPNAESNRKALVEANNQIEQAVNLLLQRENM